ncbi:glycosyl hydrolase family 95 catalytic domain-containing protein [Konateibacter massiliensis]|uniref:glycosyl hydrolase family 95 catalytic domain-containing protein n=1 Tax=Konateibacter massiliensis TaxID=2002841 RepID=UPI0015D4BA19|nr:glycoside hydrolase N-terminal domain-containing protein [Konateibacter massiliensis]
MKHILEMKYPSSWWHDTWREGLPTGNGFTGANLYGGAKCEILQLNRHDFWCGDAEEELPDVHEAFGRLREKMDAGNFKEASWEIVNALREKGYESRLEAHAPLARMVVEQVPIEGFSTFSRSLDMEHAVASQQWQDGAAFLKREVFVSREEDEVVYRLTAEPGRVPEDKISYTLELGAYQNQGEELSEAYKAIQDAASVEACCETDEVAYLYFNSIREKKGVLHQDFGAVAKVVIDGGEISTFEQRLKIVGAKEVLITIRLYVDDEKVKASKRLHDELEARKDGYEERLAKSAKLHRALYQSAELSLGEELEDNWSKSNEELLMDAFSDKQSVELIEKLWHYGRYLFLCGTNQMANPFPLYGLWCGNSDPIWCHNMANENIQMIYWHTLCGNLIDYNQSVFQYMNDRIPAFEDNARKLFGLDGIYMTAGTTPGVAAPTQVVPVIINWVGATGWIAQHYYQYFLYTKNEEYAKTVLLPFMDKTARFYEEYVCFTEDENGKERMKFYPSVSPENTPQNFMPPEGVQMAHPMPTTINSTIDLAILKEFFSQMLDLYANMEEGTFSDKRVKLWKRILASIPEYKVNEKGAIKEWQENMFEDRYDHRHLSHIYPVFPGYEYYPEKDPDEMEKFVKAVKLRKIDAQTGWSLAHMAAIYARFRDGEGAMKCLDDMAKSTLLNNFFTLHNDWRGMNISWNMDPAPVQLDAIVGYVNALQEMLLYAAPGYLALLPALEERISAGTMKKFRYHDGLISMKWNVKKAVFEVELTPIRPHKLQLVLPKYIKCPEWSGIEKNQVKQIRDGVWEIMLEENPVKVIERVETAEI